LRAASALARCRDQTRPQYRTIAIRWQRGRQFRSAPGGSKTGDSTGHTGVHASSSSASGSRTAGNAAANRVNLLPGNSLPVGWFLATLRGARTFAQ
jgi:hypothetical protein